MSDLEAPAYKSRIKRDIETAEKYLERKPARHRMEMRTIERALDKLPALSRFLDIPCGTGRATLLLAAHGYAAVGADLGEGVVEVARREVASSGLECRIEINDLEAMTYGAGSFDAVLCFRLYHHLPDDEVRARVVGELCRVARHYVLISYLHPWSFTSIKRRLRAALGGKRSRQHPTRPEELDRFFADQGFAPRGDVPVRRFLNSLHLRIYARET